MPRGKGLRAFCKKIIKCHSGRFNVPSAVIAILGRAIDDRLPLDAVFYHREHREKMMPEKANRGT
jgi:hypothetical protein